MVRAYMQESSTTTKHHKEGHHCIDENRLDNWES